MANRAVFGASGRLALPVANFAFSSFSCKSLLSEILQTGRWSRPGRWGPSPNALFSTLWGQAAVGGANFGDWRLPEGPQAPVRTFFIKFSVLDLVSKVVDFLVDFRFFVKTGAEEGFRGYLGYIWGIYACAVAPVHMAFEPLIWFRKGRLRGRWAALLACGQFRILFFLSKSLLSEIL